RPGAPQEKVRVLPGLHARYQLQVDRLDFTVGTGYAHRAPSVYAAYVVYIYNCFCRFDFNGTADLNTVTSYETEVLAGVHIERMHMATKVKYYHINNYIIGRVLS